MVENDDVDVSADFSFRENLNRELGFVFIFETSSHVFVCVAIYFFASPIWLIQFSIHAHTQYMMVHP